MLSLRSRSSSTTSTGNSGCVSSSGHDATAATMSMSGAALRIHSVNAPSNILWSSTIASRMRFSAGVTMEPLCLYVKSLYWDDSLVCGIVDDALDIDSQAGVLSGVTVTPHSRDRGPDRRIDTIARHIRAGHDDRDGDLVVDHVADRSIAGRGSQYR